jgi:hypothetical protein
MVRSAKHYPPSSSTPVPCPDDIFGRHNGVFGRDTAVQTAFQSRMEFSVGTAESISLEFIYRITYGCPEAWNVAIEKGLKIGYHRRIALISQGFNGSKGNYETIVAE